MKTQLIILFFALALFLDGHGQDAGEQDIKVVLPPELTQQPNEDEKARSKARSDLNLRASVGLPYLSVDDVIAHKSMLTLGNGARRCDHIAVASVLSCENLPLSGKLHTLIIRFNVESNLLGILNQPETIIVPWSHERTSPAKGARLLVFLAKKNLSMSTEFITWNNREQRKHQSFPPNSLFAFGDSYNIISLDNDKQAESLLTSVSGYVQHLRGQNHDEKMYYLFLKEQMRSSFSRIKEDARSDMVYFLRTSSCDLNQVVSDDGIDDGIKNYLRLFLIPEQEKIHQ